MDTMASGIAALWPRASPNVTPTQDGARLYPSMYRPLLGTYACMCWPVTCLGCGARRVVLLVERELGRLGSSPKDPFPPRFTVVAVLVSPLLSMQNGTFAAGDTSTLEFRSNTASETTFPQMPAEDFLAHEGKQYQEQFETYLADKGLLAVAQGLDPTSVRCIVDVDLWLRGAWVKCRPTQVACIVSWLLESAMHLSSSDSHYAVGSR